LWPFCSSWVSLSLQFVAEISGDAKAVETFVASIKADERIKVRERRLG